MEENSKKATEVYANAVTLANTFFDFSMLFKRDYVYETEGGQKKDTEEVAFVRMSPQMAKALCALLQNNITEYEKQFGTIPGFKAE